MKLPFHMHTQKNKLGYDNSCHGCHTPLPTTTIKFIAIHKGTATLQSRGKTAKNMGLYKVLYHNHKLAPLPLHSCCHLPVNMASAGTEAEGQGFTMSREQAGIEDFI